MPARIFALRIAVTAALGLALSVAGCTRQLYDGPALSPGEVAVIHIGDTTVLNVDDRFGFALPVGARHFEVAPGSHRVILAYDKPAKSIGLHDIPAHRGEGLCVLDFVAEAGRQYELGSQAVGTDWTIQRWDGKWEAWVRDPSLREGEDIVGRCTSTLDPPRSLPAAVAARATATPTPTPRPLAVQPVPTAPVAPVPATPTSRAARVPAAPVPPVPAAPAPAAAAPAVAAPVAAATTPASIRLGTWNLPPVAGGARNYAVTAAVIEATFDVLTLTELGGGEDYQRLVAELGDGWAGMTTRAATSGDEEHYAVLYRRDAVRPCPGWQDLRRSSVDGLKRPPAYACFEVGGYAGTPAFDFLLAAFRAVSAEDAGAIAEEVRHLDAALDEMASQRPGERDIIVAGQFHLEASELALVTSATVQSEGAGASLNLLGEPSGTLRDHILVRDPRATREIARAGAAVDVRSFAATARDFRNTVSDHLPVVVQVDIPTRDDD